MLVLVKIKVKDGAQAQFEEIVGGLSAQVKAHEPGLLTYTLGKVEGAATDYWMIEHYADAAAHEHHLNTDYFKAAIAKVGPLMDGAPEHVEFSKAI